MIVILKGFLQKWGNLSINILIHVTAVSIKAGYQWSTTAYRASYLSVYKQFELTSCSKQTVNVETFVPNNSVAEWHAKGQLVSL